MKPLLFIWLIYDATSINQAVQHQTKCDKVFMNNKSGRMWKEAVMVYHNSFHTGCWLKETC
jgi:hypothetical protein